MRYLRLYPSDASFKADEINAGGTGNDVEAMVPCIVKTADLKKMYFNPHDKEILLKTITISYKDTAGNKLAEDDVKTVKYFSGVTQEMVVTPKKIEGYICKENQKIIAIPNENVVSFIYQESKYFYEPLTFKIISGGTIWWKKSNTQSGLEKTIKYSLNDSEWITITSDAASSAPNILVNAGDVIRFAGNNDAYGYSNGNYFNSFSSSTAVRFEIEGNIMSLINAKNYKKCTELTSDYSFFRLFYDCFGVISAENFILPATTLTTGCYSGMFRGCTNITTAPELPATTLVDRCYSNMFNSCTSLTTAPELPATTLADECYWCMFVNCTSLTTTDFPIGSSDMVMAVSACSHMFSGCTSLTTAPELPATTLANYCYYGMFSGCTSLTTAPELPATTLANYCYWGIFASCTSLTQAPVLQATNLADGCYGAMFYDCTSLSAVPALPATTLARACYNSMFYRCTALTTAPELPATILTERCYNYMFGECTALTTAPELPATTLEEKCYYGMFYGCSNLNYIKCLATDKSANQCTRYWVYGVASSGTFVKSANTTWGIGNDSIPKDWVVQDATS